MDNIIINTNRLLKDYFGKDIKIIGEGYISPDENIISLVSCSIKDNIYNLMISSKGEIINIQKNN